MKKPHEQEWEWRRLDGFVVGPDGKRLTADDATDSELRFIAAAPKMARALLEVTPIWNGVAHSPLCGVYGLGTPQRCHDTCASIDSALREAGVLE